MLVCWYEVLDYDRHNNNYTIISLIIILIIIIILMQLQTSSSKMCLQYGQSNISLKHANHSCNLSAYLLMILLVN